MRIEITFNEVSLIICTLVFGILYMLGIVGKLFPKKK